MESIRDTGVPEETLQLMTYFHQDMKASFRLEGTMQEENDVQNGLRKGSQVLFYLYICLAVENRSVRVEVIEGVAITIKYEKDKELFRRYIENVCKSKITECQFADDVALLSSSTPVALEEETLRW